MTSAQLDDVLSDLMEASAEAAVWQEAWPSRAAAMADRREQAKLAILAEFDRTTAELDRLRAEARRTRPVYVRAMRYCRLLDGWKPEYDPDGGRHGNALCWMEDACRLAKRQDK